ncbi:hypothetical protein JHK86_013969 [Glycine max]|nr:hypothetical protein JHK86_013969 [Glycine max]
MVVARSTLVHLRHSASRATPPRYVMEELNLLPGWYSEPAIGCRISSRNYKKIASGVTVAWLNSEDGQGSLLPSHCTRCACSRSSRLRMPLFYTNTTLDEWVVLLLDHGIANMSLSSVVDKLLVGF